MLSTTVRGFALVGDLVRSDLARGVDLVRGVNFALVGEELLG